jgi:hypothetical protein
MEKYELAYSKNDEKITIPHILREDQPKELPYFPIEDSLMIKYISEKALPPNTVCRLIVRRHEEIRSDNEVWRYGAVMEYKKDAIALIYEEDRKIIIKAKGKKRSEYIIKLRETMDEIFKSYKSNMPDLNYRVIRLDQIEDRLDDKKEIFLSKGAIKSHIHEKKPYLTEYGWYIPYESLCKTVQVYQIQIGEIKMGDITNSPYARPYFADQDYLKSVSK